MAAKIDTFLEREGSTLGLGSRAQVVVAAIRDYLETKKPRFEHVNTFEDHAKIADYELHRIVSVYFKEEGSAWCDYHEATSCVHIDYALTLPEVHEAMKKKGWKRREYDLTGPTRSVKQ